MAEIAGPNPAEPIVLFTTGHTRSVCWGFVGYESLTAKVFVDIFVLTAICYLFQI